MDPGHRVRRQQRRDAANLEWFLVLVVGAVVYLAYEVAGSPEPRWLWIGGPLVAILLLVLLARRRWRYGDEDRDFP